MLTGKCKTDFEKWFYRFSSNNKSITSDIWAKLEEMDGWDKMISGVLETFYGLLPAFQQGIYMAFFRAKGYDIVILILTLFNGEHDYEYRVYNWNEQRRYEADMMFYSDYNTAFTEAVKTANKIYNEKRIKENG